MDTTISKNKECPVCEPVAPFWMTTFADMALLLMAFFALMYSFVNLEAHEQTKFAASIRTAFGIFTLDVVDSEDRSDSVPGKTYIDKVLKGMPLVISHDGQKNSESDINDLPRGKDTKLEFSVEGVAKKLEAVLSKEMEKGEVKVKIAGERVVVELQSFVTSGGEAPFQTATLSGNRVPQAILDIAAQITQIQAKTDVKVDVVKQKLNDEDPLLKARKKDVAQTYQNLLEIFEDEIESNSALVQLKEDQLLVRLSNADAFMSGRATLNREAKRALSKLGQALNTTLGKVRVEGHSDSIPIIFSERFISNWDLSAARAASVASVLIQDSGMDTSQFKIVGFADSKPIASNATERGRRSNRRTDIFIAGSSK
tara:strand:- start:5075 stop:6184 length:1110 start_codon:yes stop_codon:yes gene_type:complete